jgi:hypothetical protein
VTTAIAGYPCLGNFLAGGKYLGTAALCWRLAAPMRGRLICDFPEEARGELFEQRIRGRDIRQTNSGEPKEFRYLVREIVG